MYTSKCVIQNCYIKLLFKYLKVQGLTNVCVFDLFALWLHFKFGRTLIETWYTHVVFVACSSVVGLHICILNYFSLICIRIFCNSLLMNHVFLCITLRLHGLLVFFKVSLFFCVSGWIWDTTHIHVGIVFAEVNTDRNMKQTLTLLRHHFLSSVLCIVELNTSIV